LGIDRRHDCLARKRKRSHTLEKVGQIIDKSLVSHGVHVRVHLCIRHCLCVRMRASPITISKTSGRVRPDFELTDDYVRVLLASLDYCYCCYCYYYNRIIATWQRQTCRERYRNNGFPLKKRDVPRCIFELERAFEERAFIDFSEIDEMIIRTRLPDEYVDLLNIGSTCAYRASEIILERRQGRRKRIRLADGCLSCDIRCR